MPATVSANLMTVVHQNSDGQYTGFPDACKTPTPAGPVPIPYPNIAFSKDTSKGTITVKCDGHPINVKDSCFIMSQGDEAGSALGVLSNKIKGKAEWMNYSPNVKADGKNVCRLLDPMISNGGSSDNTPPIPETQPPDPSLVALNEAKKKACEELEKKRVSKKDAQEKSGQLPEHFDANCKAAQKNDTALAFRDTNPKSQPHIAEGMQTKMMDIKDKTAKDGPFAGTVVHKNGNQVLKGGSPVTSDYDLHDMVRMGSRGSIPGGSFQEKLMIWQLNQNMHQALPSASSPMVNHGAWTEWANPPPGTPKCALPDVPEVGKGATAIVPDKATGECKFYHLETKKDWKNFRECLE